MGFKTWVVKLYSLMVSCFLVMWNQKKLSIDKQLKKYVSDIFNICSTVFYIFTFWWYT
jgi:hypothetical protein